MFRSLCVYRACTDSYIHGHPLAYTQLSLPFIGTCAECGIQIELQNASLLHLLHTAQCFSVEAAEAADTFKLKISLGSVK